MIDWLCRACQQPQVAWSDVPPDRTCHACRDRQAAAATAEQTAGIPPGYRGLTRQSWEKRFGRSWPARAAAWSGSPHWFATYGPTGTGKTGLATVLLAEHLRTGRRGRWISGAELSRRIQLNFSAADEVLSPLLVTGLLVLDEPFTGAATDWYIERLGLICRTRDERRLPTVVTAQELPELFAKTPPGAPPALLSRMLSGIRLPLKGDDVRLLRQEPA